MNYVVDKVKGGVKKGCVHFDTPSLLLKGGGWDSNPRHSEPQSDALTN